MYRILTIDGGGMRGLIPAVVLAELESRARRPIADMFDLIAATSTGALIALALLRPGRDGRPAWTAAELAGSYQTDGGHFFERSPWRAVWTLDGLVAAKYGDRPLTHALQTWLGDTMLSNSLKPVLATSYDVRARRPFVFSSADVARGVLPDQAMWRVARCSAAGPTYFRPACVSIGDRERWFVDGALAANNPAMYALAHAYRQGISTVDIALVSLGTGSVATPYETPLLRAGGLLGWITGARGRLLVNAIIDGQSDAVAVQARANLPDKHYVRFDVELGAACEPIDDSSPANIARLNDAVTDMLAASSARVDHVIDLLRGVG